MIAVWAVFAAAWPLTFLVVGLCNIDWGKRGGL